MIERVVREQRCTILIYLGSRVVLLVIALALAGTASFPWKVPLP